MKTYFSLCLRIIFFYRIQENLVCSCLNNFICARVCFYATNYSTRQDLDTTKKFVFNYKLVLNGFIFIMFFKFFIWMVVIFLKQNKIYISF